MSFTRLEHIDEADWLTQRREHITATEVGQLEKSQSAFRRIAAEKEHGSSFPGNRWWLTRTPPHSQWSITQRSPMPNTEGLYAD